MAGTAPRDIVIGYRMREIKRERERTRTTMRGPEGETERERLKGQVSPSYIGDDVTER